MGAGDKHHALSERTCLRSLFVQPRSRLGLPLPGQVSNHNPSRFPAQPVTVLVVDDNPAVRSVLCRTMEAGLLGPCRSRWTRGPYVSG